MRINKNFDLTNLVGYGFKPVDKEDEDYAISYFDYALDLGHSRRGQFYYLLVKSETRAVFIYASDPDGSGGSLGLKDVIIALVKDNVLVADE
jgi:hypothetical protein